MLTGKPDAGNPPVRFGGRGGESHPRSYPDPGKKSPLALALAADTVDACALLPLRVLGAISANPFFFSFSTSLPLRLCVR